MKKELQKTTSVNNAISNGAALPAAPSPFANRGTQQPGSDPSSSFRSSRYPVPQFEFRTQATQ